MTPAISATCSVHATAPAAFTCTRCGTFACEGCRSPFNLGQCATCDARGEKRLDVGGTVSSGLQLLTRTLPVVAPLAVVQWLTGLMGLPFTLRMREAQQAHATEALAENLGSMLLVMLLGMGMFSVIAAMQVRLLGDAAEGRTRPAGEALREGLSRALPLLGVSLLATLGVGGGLVLCAAPGVFLAIAWSLAVQAVVLGRRGPVASLRDSWGRTAGVRLNVFLVLLVGVAVLVASSILNTVLAPPLADVSRTRVVAAFVVTQALGAASMALLHALCTATYVRLQPAAGR